MTLFWLSLLTGLLQGLLMWAQTILSREYAVQSAHHQSAYYPRH